MTMKSMLLLALFTIISLGACDKNTDGPASTCIPLVLNESMYINGPFDTTTSITSASISSDCLSVSFSYTGGCCDEHDLNLIWDGSVAESFPVQVWVRVLHDNQDPCDAIETKTLEYDVSSFGEKPARIHLEGWADELLWE